MVGREVQVREPLREAGRHRLARCHGLGPTAVVPLPPPVKGSTSDMDRGLSNAATTYEQSIEHIWMLAWDCNVVPTCSQQQEPVSYSTDSAAFPGECLRLPLARFRT